LVEQWTEKQQETCRENGVVLMISLLKSRYLPMLGEVLETGENRGLPALAGVSRSSPPLLPRGRDVHTVDMSLAKCFRERHWHLGLGFNQPGSVLRNLRLHLLLQSDRL
jgi:hypothetical protein